MGVVTKVILTAMIVLLAGVLARGVFEALGLGFYLTLGILGALIILLWTSGKNRSDDTDLKKCPYCCEMVNSEALLCKHCGKDISDDALASEFEDIRAKQQLNGLGIQSINLLDNSGKTPLIKYAEEGNKDIVTLLLIAGADKHYTVFGYTAEETARNAGHSEVAD